MRPDPHATILPREQLADDLDVVRARALAGPNRWRREPAITGDVLPGPLAGHPALLREATTRLREELPGLDLAESGDADEGEAEDAGRGWAELIAALATLLQREAGSDVGAWRVIAPGDEPESWAFAVGYEEEGVGLASVRAAARLVRRVVRGDALAVLDAVDDLRARHEREALGPTASLVVAAARERGIPVRRTPGERVVQLGLGCRLHRIDAATTDRTSVIAADIAADRERTFDVLANLGLPVPRSDDDERSLEGHAHRVLVVHGRVV